MKILALFLVIISLFLFTQKLEAKVLPQARGQKAALSKPSTGGGIGVSPRLRADKRALVVYFSNLQNASSVSYFLTYKQGLQQEGAGGTLNLSGGQSQTAELLFGTCSRNVCRYHTGISNMKLEISYTNKSGKKA